MKNAEQWLKDNPIPPGIFSQVQELAIATYAKSAYMSGLVDGARIGLDKLEQLARL